MKSLLIVLSFLSAPAFAVSEVTNPEEMVTCLRTFINQRLASPESPVWEHEPRFEFGGKYLNASWHGSIFGKMAKVFGYVGPDDLVYCDYESSNGLPNPNSKGFCKPNVVNGDLEIEYTKYEANGPSSQMRRIAFIRDSKIYCYY